MMDREKARRAELLGALRVADAVHADHGDDLEPAFRNLLPDDATGYVRVCQGEDGEWCIRARARNGATVIPPESYPRREHAVRGFLALREALRSPIIDAGD